MFFGLQTVACSDFREAYQKFTKAEDYILSPYLSHFLLYTPSETVPCLMQILYGWHVAFHHNGSINSLAAALLVWVITGPI